MANFEKLIPYILYRETGGAKSCWKIVNGKRVYDPTAITIHQQFVECKDRGFANDPLDSGGATMCGVTIATYRAYRAKKGYKTTGVADLKAISYAEWCDLYKSQFWDKWKADDINDQAIANILVDFVWASGIHGIKVPQRTLKVVADGIVGPKTLAAVNAYNPQLLFRSLQLARIAFVDGIVRSNPSQRKWINGWKRRINGITYNGFIYD